MTLLWFSASSPAQASRGRCAGQLGPERSLLVLGDGLKL